MAIPRYNGDVAYWLEKRRLDGWFEIATDDLQEADKGRIGREIEAHYIESVLALEAEGQSRRDAEATALANLGDPEEANRKFRKNHVTEPDLKSLEWLERMAERPFFSGERLPFDALAVVAIPLCFFSGHWLSILRMIGVSSLVCWVGYRLVPQLIPSNKFSRISSLESLALCNLITMMVFFCAIFVPNYSSLHRDFFVKFIWPIFYGFRWVRPIFRVWNKLRKMEDGRNPMPPRAAMSS